MRGASTLHVRVPNQSPKQRSESGASMSQRAREIKAPAVKIGNCFASCTPAAAIGSGAMCATPFVLLTRAITNCFAWEDGTRRPFPKRRRKLSHASAQSGTRVKCQNCHCRQGCSAIATRWSPGSFRIAQGRLQWQCIGGRWRTGGASSARVHKHARCVCHLHASRAPPPAAPSAPLRKRGAASAHV